MTYQTENQTLELEGETLHLRTMTAADQDAVLAFARKLPAHDLLFLSRDITNEKVVSAWARDLEAGSIQTALAFEGEEVVGCAALLQDPLSWSPHVGDIRVVVAESMRGKGLGRMLIQEAFKLAIAKDLSKITARMTVDQKGAIAIFEEMGFRGEALLKDHVRDADGTLHDLVILSCDPARAASLHAAYADGDV